MFDTHLVIDTVEETWHRREDGGSQLGDIIHEFPHVPTIEAHAAPIQVHIQLADPLVGVSKREVGDHHIVWADTQECLNITKAMGID